MIKSWVIIAGGAVLTVAVFVIAWTSKLHKSELMVEKGIVIGKTYLPDNRGVSTGVGVSSNGDAVVTVHTTGEPESFNVVFQCEHGVIFSINDKSVYTKLMDQDSVKINYYELLNRKNIVKDYEFVDAEKLVHH